MSGSVEVRQTQRPHVCCVYFILFCLWWWLLAFVIVLLIVVVLRFLVPFNTVPVKCFLLCFFLIYMRIVLSYLFVINNNYISICNFYWPITFLFHNLDICTLIILLFVIYMPLLCFLFYLHVIFVLMFCFFFYLYFMLLNCTLFCLYFICPNFSHFVAAS